MKYHLGIFFSGLLLGCNIQPQDPGNLKTKQHWKTGSYTDSVQILLTNEYAFEDTYGYGASSFLIVGKKDALLCTAKHLLGEAMGISPKVKTKDYTSTFKFWKSFARNNRLIQDTVRASGIVNESFSTVDILLQRCKTIPTNIQPLRPRFSRIRPGEELEIIGCEYRDSSCNQKRYEAVMDEYNKNTLIVRARESFKPRGFSGAPVIDKNGYAVGVVIGGGIFEGKLYLSVEPLLRVKKYLK